MSAQEYFPQNHPLKEKFRQFGFPQVAIRNYLRQNFNIQISTSRLTQFLNGYDKLPKRIHGSLEPRARPLKRLKK